MRIEFKILSINISEKKGEQKKPVKKATLKTDHGILGDAHAGNWHRQISVLADEDIDIMRESGIDLHPGDFAENITTRGISWKDIPVGTKIYIGKAVLELTQLGKKCHHDCEVFKKVGDCVMPRRGIFAKVMKSGTIDLNSNCYVEY